MKVSYGTRAIIGVINIASTVNLEPEFYAMAPEGVAVLTGRVPLPKTTPEELEKLSVNALEATRQLASARPDIIIFACTSGSFIKGAGYDREVTEMLQAASDGIPVVTTSAALLEALRALRLEKIGFCSPYIDIVNERAEKYLTDNGVQVLRKNGLGLDTDYEIGLQSEAAVRQLARSVNTQDAEGIVISCTNLRTADILNELEREFAKPVVSANQASFWHALRTVGIQDKLEHFGRLMQL